jgi:hypothetical protein
MAVSGSAPSRPFFFAVVSAVAIAIRRGVLATQADVHKHFHDGSALLARSRSGELEHDPENWEPIFPWGQTRSVCPEIMLTPKDKIDPTNPSGAQPERSAALLVVARRLATLHELRSCRLIMTAAAAKEHQGHQATSDDKREERAEAKSDPAMFGHRNVVAGGPYRCRPDNGDDKDRYQRAEQNEMAAAERAIFRRFRRR